MPRTALITGITGQDGAYLTQLLLSNDYRVFGACRRTSPDNLWRLDVLDLVDLPRLQLCEFDLTDPDGVLRLIE